jgi:hypothetical protein
MSDALIELEASAKTIAEAFCENVNVDKIDVELIVVPREMADGTNSLDQRFFDDLNNGEHLDDSFLSF